MREDPLHHRPLPRPSAAIARPAAFHFPAPVTVARFMETALYHPDHGYYATRAQRSGARGDFFTSVDTGPLFGEMIAEQLVEMRARLRAAGSGEPFDLVEAGAGNGRLTRDILDALAEHHPAVYADVRVTLVERSAAARDAAHATLTGHLPRVADIRESLPPRLRGVLLANELLDAFPVHVLAMTPDGLREVYLQDVDGRLSETPGPVSDPRLVTWFRTSFGPSRDDPPEGPCPTGAMDAPERTEVSLAVPDWIASAARAIDMGFLLLFDYVAPAAPRGLSLTSYARHVAMPRWFDAPGTRDITSHVDLPALQRAALAAGFVESGACRSDLFPALPRHRRARRRQRPRGRGTAAGGQDAPAPRWAGQHDEGASLQQRRRRPGSHRLCRWPEDIAVDSRQSQSQSAVGSRQSTVDSRQSAVASRQSAVGGRRSAVGGRRSAVDGQVSAIG